MIDNLSSGLTFPEEVDSLDISIPKPVIEHAWCWYLIHTVGYWSGVDLADTGELSWIFSLSVNVSGLDFVLEFLEPLFNVLELVLSVLEGFLEPLLLRVDRDSFTVE
jgi:hypothetical protein